MKTEELLKPRYKVIADYPKSIYKVGTIINSGWRTEDLLYCDWDGPRMRDYPHLFRPLEWWEDRKPEDMPEYVKMNKMLEHARFEYGDILKVTKWEPDEDGKELYFQFEGDPKGDLGQYPRHFLPATEAEYQAFINPLPAEPGDK